MSALPKEENLDEIKTYSDKQLIYVLYHALLMNAGTLEDIKDTGYQIKGKSVQNHIKLVVEYNEKLLEKLEEAGKDIFCP